MRLIAILGAVVSFAFLACALHHPVNVDPDYPPPTPFALSRDAGHE